MESQTPVDPTTAISDHQLAERACGTAGTITVCERDLTAEVEAWARADTVEGKAERSVRILGRVAALYGLSNPWEPFAHLENMALASTRVFYRDHTLHTVRVLLICYAADPNSDALLRAAVLHDIGVLPAQLSQLLDREAAEPYRGIFEAMTGDEPTITTEMDILPTLSSGMYFWLNRLAKCAALQDDKRRFYGALCDHYVDWLPRCVAYADTSGKTTHAFVSASLYLKAALRSFLETRLVPPLNAQHGDVGDAEQAVFEAVLPATLILFHDLGSGDPPADIREMLPRLPHLVAADEIAEWGRVAAAGDPPIVGVQGWALEGRDQGLAVTAQFECRSAVTHSVERAHRIAETILAKAYNLVRAGVAVVHLEFRQLDCEAGPLWRAAFQKNREYGRLATGTRGMLAGLRERLSGLVPAQADGKPNWKAHNTEMLANLRLAIEANDAVWTVEPSQKHLPINDR